MRRPLRRIVFLALAALTIGAATQAQVNRGAVSLDRQLRPASLAAFGSTTSAVPNPGPGNVSTNEAPVCPAPAVVTVWPPNHAMVPIMLSGAFDADGDPLTYSAMSIFQDEPLDGDGDGDTSPDAMLDPVLVRAERAGGPKNESNGRVYYINFTATDPAGESCNALILVCVPRSQGGIGGGSCIPDGPLVDSTRP